MFIDAHSDFLLLLGLLVLAIVFVLTWIEWRLSSQAVGELVESAAVLNGQDVSELMQLLAETAESVASIRRDMQAREADSQIKLERLDAKLHSLLIRYDTRI